MELTYSTADMTQVSMDGVTKQDAQVSCPYCVSIVNTVDSRLSARGLTALRLNRGNVFLKKKFYFP
jgi:hypothetical protein